MALRLTAYLPDGPAVDHLLETAGVLGRASECLVVLDHASVSRRHAELLPQGSGWSLRDLGSKNGSFIDGEAVALRQLENVAWARFGDVVCELALIDEATERRLREAPQKRRAVSMLHLQRIEREPDLPAVLEATLAAIIDLAGCERGFLLVPDAGGLKQWTREGLRPSADMERGFPGSLGVVQRAFETRRPVVINDARLDAMGTRASIVAQGLRSLLCLPLCSGDELLALAYADSRRAGPPITQADLELLAALAERAAIWIVARRNAARLDAAAKPVPDAPHDSGGRA